MSKIKILRGTHAQLDDSNNRATFGEGEIVFDTTLNRLCVFINEGGSLKKYTINSDYSGDANFDFGSLDTTMLPVVTQGDIQAIHWRANGSSTMFRSNATPHSSSFYSKDWYLLAPQNGVWSPSPWMEKVFANADYSNYYYQGNYINGISNLDYAHKPKAAFYPYYSGDQAQGNNWPEYAESYMDWSSEVWTNQWMIYNTSTWDPITITGYGIRGSSQRRIRIYLSTMEATPADVNYHWRALHGILGVQEYQYTTNNPNDRYTQAYRPVADFSSTEVSTNTSHTDVSANEGGLASGNVIDNYDVGLAHSSNDNMRSWNGTSYPATTIIPGSAFVANNQLSGWNYTTGGYENVLMQEEPDALSMYQLLTIESLAHGTYNSMYVNSVMVSYEVDIYYNSVSNPTERVFTFTSGPQDIRGTFGEYNTQYTGNSENQYGDGIYGPVIYYPGEGQ